MTDRTNERERAAAQDLARRVARQMAAAARDVELAANGAATAAEVRSRVDAVLTKLAETARRWAPGRWADPA